MDNSFLYTKTLLLVDDELDLLKMLSDILKDAGFQKILMADTGKEAVAEAKKGKPDLIILDPPRDGIHPKALDKIIDFGVDRMVYISCKPTSLARDLVTLQSSGYRVEKCCCIDLFPSTYHCETVCLLGKRKPDTKVKIGIDMDDYYRIRENAESK